MIRIGIIGDFNPKSETHIATDACLRASAAIYGLTVEIQWMATHSLHTCNLSEYSGLLINTGVYLDRNAVLHALRVAREEDIPTLASCGGFQHMMLEYARNVCGLRDVGHAEFDTDTNDHIIVPLTCSLRGLEGEISVSANSKAAKLCRVAHAIEKFYCSFGINQ